MNWPPSLTEAQKQALKRGQLTAAFASSLPAVILSFRIGRVNGALDLLVTSVPELSKRCKLPPFEIKSITELVCKNFAPETHTLEEWVSHHENAQGWLSTGDATLDRVFGGGVRTGMIWEFVGERWVFVRRLALRDAALKHLGEAHPEKHSWRCNFLSSYNCLLTWVACQVPPAILLQT